MNASVIVTAGHVDHGKSTVIGRFLYDAGLLPKGKIEAVKATCEKNARPFEYAFLLDALKTEQAQGITLDVARNFFEYKNKRYEVLDAPGHLELLKNMITGASRADGALMVIDVSRGIEANTKQHFYFLKTLEIKQIYVAVNKMDLIGFDEKVYKSTVAKTEDFLREIDLKVNGFIPVSGVLGDNVVNRSERMPWYDGPTIGEAFASYAETPSLQGAPLRLPVQDVYKFTENGDSRRIVAGELVSGTIAVGEEIAFLPSGKKTIVKSIENSANSRLTTLTAGYPAGITLADEIIVKRGEIIVNLSEPQPSICMRFSAKIFWLGKNPLIEGKEYILKICTRRVSARVEKIEKIVSAVTLEEKDGDKVNKNEIAEAIISVDKPVVFDVKESIPDTSRFVIVDDYEISGGGIIKSPLCDESYDGRNLRVNVIRDAAKEKAAFLGSGAVFWLTGLSGSGKSTIAAEAESMLTKNGIRSFVLDGDELRRTVCKDLGFSSEDRRKNVIRVAEIAKLFKDSCCVTLVTLISPFRDSRAKAKEIIGENFYEIFVSASLRTCKNRDPKGFYKKAGNNEIREFTGVSSPYEEPLNPDLIVDTETLGETEAAQFLYEFIVKKLANN